MRYFFRGNPDGVYFKMFTPIHFLLLALTILGIYLIYKYRDRLQEDKISKIFKNTIGIVLALQQIILYLWYIYTGYSGIKESLPLYNCRLAVIFAVLALFTGKKIFKSLAVYWGVYGGILALIVVVGDPFLFPHYTMVSFFVCHILLLWSCFYFLFVEKYELNKKNLKFTLQFTTIFHLILLIFNISIGANYDYLIEPPIFKSYFSLMPQLLYSFIAIIIFNLLIVLFSFVVRIIRNNKQEIVEEFRSLRQQ